MWHASSICDMICDMTHSYVIWLIHMWHDSFICDMTHSYVIWLIHMWHDSFICDMTHPSATWLIHMWHDSFIHRAANHILWWPRFDRIWIDTYAHSHIRTYTHSHIHTYTHTYIRACICRAANRILWHDALVCDMTSLCVTWLVHNLMHMAANYVLWQARLHYLCK